MNSSASLTSNSPGAKTRGGGGRALNFEGLGGVGRGAIIALPCLSFPSSPSSPAFPFFSSFSSFSPFSSFSSFSPFSFFFLGAGTSSDPPASSSLKSPKTNSSSPSTLSGSLSLVSSGVLRALGGGGGGGGACGAGFTRSAGSFFASFFASFSASFFASFLADSTAFSAAFSAAFFLRPSSMTSSFTSFNFFLMVGGVPGSSMGPKAMNTSSVGFFFPLFFNGMTMHSTPLSSKPEPYMMCEGMYSLAGDFFLP
mmetsp:Transcript_14201/g.28998  ORF Transcript_14201/g.28998 Transcript_14201/m.28998 type:complete len:254 (+) Transcript_14201:185-946(+)